MHLDAYSGAQSGTEGARRALERGARGRQGCATGGRDGALPGVGQSCPKAGLTELSPHNCGHLNSLQRLYSFWLPRRLS